ncbi:energy transducer TonB [Tsuneonella rigui]|jgi:outer membrane biosynthesis protein TonB|uniref:energy transducer TonB n=1 Tax=Tsuneonella rigui TaxID=1708790 RepID=UPI000F7D88D6|nr:energy transducer TonB [Tsuneonella rigui]
MVFANLRREERIGLGIALALHVALGVALLIQPASRKTIPPIEKMTVNLATDVGLEATAPEPVPESAAAIAPTLAPEPAPPAESVPQPAVAQPIQRPQPVATTPPKPKPVPRATTAPKPKPPSTEPRRRPDAPASQTRSAPKPKPAGGSRIGADFLPGAGSSTTTRETRVPASQIGASAKASLVQAIAREIKPKWQPPDGPDVDKITTYLRFRLNTDGSLQGRPELVRQTGVNDTNRAQAGRHAEQAIRAVQLAAPFDLPDEYYNAWKLVGPFGFDWKLAQ